VSAASAPQTTNVLTNQPSFPQISNVTNPVARFILTADAIEDSLTSDNCSTNSSFFFLISELTFLKVSTHFVKLSIWSVRNF
jgi:hypothetical protein